MSLSRRIFVINPRRTKTFYARKQNNDAPDTKRVALVRIVLNLRDFNIIATFVCVLGNIH